MSDHSTVHPPPAPAGDVDLRDPLGAHAPGAVADFALALRLGWSVAEARGRSCIGPARERLGLEPETDPHLVAGRDLPLNIERSMGEQRREAEGVLAIVAQQADVDPPCGRLSGCPGTDTELATERLHRLTMAVAGLAHEEDAALEGAPVPDMTSYWTTRPAYATSAAALDALLQFFWQWDAWIQGRLATEPFGTSSAYQLGRGLAETFWALDLRGGCPGGVPAAILFGPDRVQALTELLTRLAGRQPRRGAALATAGVLGVSATGLSARVKQQAQDIFGRLRDDLDSLAIADVTYRGPQAPRPAARAAAANPLAAHAYAPAAGAPG